MPYAHIKVINVLRQVSSSTYAIFLVLYILYQCIDIIFVTSRFVHHVAPMVTATPILGRYTTKCNHLASIEFYVRMKLGNVATTFKGMVMPANSSNSKAREKRTLPVISHDMLTPKQTFPAHNRRWPVVYHESPTYPLVLVMRIYPIHRYPRMSQVDTF